MTDIEASVPTQQGRRSLRRFAIWCLVIVLLIGTSFLMGSRGSDPRPLDPESAKPDGTKALKLLSQELGAKFEVSSTAPDISRSVNTNATALILRDDLSVNETQRLEEWIQTGGTLIVADTTSSFAARARLSMSQNRNPQALKADCNEAFATGVNEIRPENDRLYKVIEPTNSARSSTVGCFPVHEGFYVIVDKTGLGRTVIVGGSDIFTNQELDEADNAVFVANLLDARDGQTISYMRTNEAGTGTRGALDVIPDRARNVIWQLSIAGLLLIVWKWRRLGKPVLEPQPVEVPASSLVTAVGSLMQAGKRDSRAAVILRDDLRRVLAEKFGLPSDVDAEVLVEVTASHLRIDAERVREVLIGRPVESGTELIELAQRVELIRRELV